MALIRTVNTLFMNNTVHRVIALVLAYALWSLFSSWYVIEMTYTVPVRVTAAEHQQVTAPSFMTITLRGLRRQLRALDTHALAVHINTRELGVGNQILTPTVTHLGIPAGTLNIAAYSPLNAVVSVQEKSPQL